MSDEGKLVECKEWASVATRSEEECTYRYALTQQHSSMMYLDVVIILGKIALGRLRQYSRIDRHSI